MSLAIEALKRILKDPYLFARHTSGITFRPYQIEPARAIVRSVVENLGLTIIVEMSRQAGKNELQRQIEAYLLVLYKLCDREIVKVSPTYRPQTINSMRKLRLTLDRNSVTRAMWQKEYGFIYRIGHASIAFFSGQKEANVVGATASLLLEADEAQDILMSKWDKDFSPMAASTNATTLLMGTAWTDNTLLYREKLLALEAEKLDGIKRVFRYTADEVARVVPAYGEYVKKQIKKLGRQHPLIKTQYFLEEIGAEGGMFPPARRALMRGNHLAQDEPIAGKLYVATIDVAGEDEDAAADGDILSVGQHKRDNTTVTMYEVDTSTIGEPMLEAPTYKAVHRWAWVGMKHPAVYGQIRAILETWGIAYVVVDGTGVGEPLASFLRNVFGDRAIVFVFNRSTKSKLGYRYLGVVDSGRYKEFAEDGSNPQQEALQSVFWKELDYCQYQIVPGPNKTMIWGVPDGQRDKTTGEYVHDDMITDAALVAELDGCEWPSGLPGFIVKGSDPLAEIDRGDF